MDYKKVASQILEKVGGKDNVSFATFCATRLRLTLKDKGLIDEEGIKGIQEVYGIRHAGTQFQIIIGNEVSFVYKEFCALASIEANEGIDEVIESDISSTKKEKLTFKKVVDNVMDVLSACVTQVIPIITTCGLIKLIVAILGPSMLNVLSAENDLIRLLTFVGDAGFFFYPIFVAYGAAKKFECSIPLSLLLAAILIHPTLIEIVNAGEPFTVFGIPMILGNYAYSFLPILFIVWGLSYVEKFFQKISPTSLKFLVVPLGCVLVMLPLSLCVFGPMGTVLGQVISDGIMMISKVFGPLASALIAGLFPFLIVTGMHTPIISIGLMNMAQQGYEATIFPASDICTYSMIAIALAAIIKAKKAEDRGSHITSFLTMTVGGISEPLLYSIVLKSKKAIAYLFLGGFAGGLYVGLMHVIVTIPSPGNFLTFLCYSGDTANFINGIIGCVITFAVTFGLGLVLGFDDKK